MLRPALTPRSSPQLTLGAQQQHADERLSASAELSVAVAHLQLSGTSSALAARAPGLKRRV
jgi:hypothetical protein